MVLAYVYMDFDQKIDSAYYDNLMEKNNYSLDNNGLLLSFF